MEAAMIELYQMGKEAREAGRPGEAETYFRRLVELGCRFADVFNDLGVIDFERGNLDGARSAFLEAIEVNPKYTEAHLNLAVTLNELGEYESGAASFQRARKASLVDQGVLDPYVRGRLANIHADIGEIYHGLGLHDDAEGEYGKALHLGPNFPDLRTRLGILFRDMGEYDRALAEFGKVRQEHPRFAEAALQLGITYFSRGQVDLAVDEWNTLLERDPGNAKALMYLKLAERDHL